MAPKSGGSQGTSLAAMGVIAFLIFIVLMYVL